MEKEEEEFQFSWTDVLAIIIATFESLAVPLILLIIAVILIVVLLRAVFL